MTPRLRDFDSGARAQNIRAGAWAGLAGAVFAAPGALLYGVPGLIGGWLAGALVFYLGSLALAHGAGSVFSRIYLTSGSSTPQRREYSLGDALINQGRLEDAVREFERAVAAYPLDAEPRLRLARLYRDRLPHMDRAEYWFRQAMNTKGIDAGLETLAARELVELYTHRLQQPERALPILARLADRHRGTTAGEWARTELQDLKQRVRRGGHD